MGKNYATVGGWLGLIIPIVYQIGFDNELSLLVGTIFCIISALIGALIGSRIQRS